MHNLRLSICWLPQGVLRINLIRMHDRHETVRTRYMASLGLQLDGQRCCCQMLCAVC